jgi:hypothetical protein
MKAHEEWQAHHGYARAENNHEASYVDTSIDYLPDAFPDYAGHCKREDHVWNLHSSADDFNTEYILNNTLPTARTTVKKDLAQDL